jgi:tetratricopeptide (TPR) repeat protein
MESRLRARCSTAGFGRVASAGLLIFFALAAYATLRLAAAESKFRWIGARQETEETPQSLRAAVGSNPRDSSAWITLGLAAERAHEPAEAARDFGEAEKVDRQYLPAWTSANFFFRRRNIAPFWSAAARAAALVYDDPRPLIDLADRMEPDPAIALSRLGATSALERAYLDYLIGGSRWDQAQSVAEKILARANGNDSERLRDFTDRLIGAGRGDAALSLCRRVNNCPVPDLAARNILVNGAFGVEPGGHGFDWQIVASPNVRAQWKTGQLGLIFSGSEPDESALLEQPVLLPVRGCRLEFEYQAPATGLRWALSQGDSPQQTGPALTASEGWAPGGWNIAARKTGLARLRLLYRREPGSRRIVGRAAVRQVRLEAL